MLLVMRFDVFGCFCMYVNDKSERTEGSSLSMAKM